MIQIPRLLNRIKTAEAKNDRTIGLTLAEAKDLHSEITLLLLTNESLRSAVESAQDESQEISITGGAFKNA